MKHTTPRHILLLALALCSTAAAEPKRVLVCTVTTGFRHSSIPVAEQALEKIGADSGAYTVVGLVQQPDVVVPQAPRPPKALAADADEKATKRHQSETEKYNTAMAAWTPAVQAEAAAAKAKFDTEVGKNLARLSPVNLEAEKIDAVIFANTTGDLPLPDAPGFIKWVESGHAFIAMHSGSDTFHGFTGYTEMLQGEFAGHGAQVPADLVAADAAHPANAGIGGSWDLAQEEMYLIKSHDRSKVRSLWHLRHNPNKVEEKGYFPVSWCREIGSGARVFYTSLGHREDLWSDSADIKDRKNSAEVSKQFQAHILGGIKWALKLADGSAAPNPEVP